MSFSSQILALKLQLLRIIHAWLCILFFFLVSLPLFLCVCTCVFVVSRLMWLARASGVNNIVSAPSTKRWNVAAALYYAVDHLLHYQIYTESSVDCTHTDICSHRHITSCSPTTYTKHCNAGSEFLMYVYFLCYYVCVCMCEYVHI